MPHRAIPHMLAATLLALSASAMAQTTISPGGSVSGSVAGTSSIYQVFGHTGTSEPSQVAATTDAPYVSFNSGDSFTFTSVTGGVNCCSNPGNLFTPDGGGGNSSVLATNGLSAAVGNTALGLVAVFTSESDPFGGTPPATLPWDAANAGSLAPALNQVFFVGDGREGFNNAAGGLLTFTAPEGATRLYVGFADAFSFQGPSSYYQDNPGTIDYTVTLAPVPEPESLVLVLTGLTLAGLLARRRQTTRR